MCRVARPTPAPISGALRPSPDGLHLRATTRRPTRPNRGIWSRSRRRRHAMPSPAGSLLLVHDDHTCAVGTARTTHRPRTGAILVVNVVAWQSGVVMRIARSGLGPCSTGPDG